MPTTLRPPNRIEPVNFPVFDLSWYADGGTDGTSIVAYGGGGGSARTGICNKIIVQVNHANNDNEQTKQVEIDTGTHVCVNLVVYPNVATQNYWLVAGMMEKTVVRYALKLNDVNNGTSFGTLAAGTAHVGVETNVVAVNARANRLAVGCKDATVHLYEISDDSNDFVPLGVCRGHEMLYDKQGREKDSAICALSFAEAQAEGTPPLLVSSARDGTARVWDYERQTCLATLTCVVKEDPMEGPPKKRNLVPQVSARGCAFGDLEGKVIYTVAATQRSKAFLSLWRMVGNGNGGITYECEKTIPCCPTPISSMSLSADKTMLALGGADGSVYLYSMETWKLLKKFPDVHSLPVMAVAARPYSTPLPGDDKATSIRMHALSASADSRFALLTMQRLAIMSTTSALVLIALLSWVVHYLAQETSRLCSEEWSEKAFGKFVECLHHTVLIAPDTRPGVLVPPH